MYLTFGLVHKVRLHNNGKNLSALDITPSSHCWKLQWWSVWNL